jgi:hypothetical protein
MGEGAQVINFIGPVEFVERTVINGDTVISEIEHTQTWITPKTYDCAVFIDKIDQARMIYDPSSPYVERFREAAARRMDEIVMSQFFANRRSGKDGLISSAFGSTNTVVHGGTAFTVAKLRAVRKLIRKRHVDLRSVKPYIAVTSDEIDNLLGEVAVGSNDYNSVKPLVDGDVSSFMGFTFIPYEDSGTVTQTNGKGIPTRQDSGTVRQCPVWVPEGMHFGTWDALSITVSPRPDKNNIKQIHGEFIVGATRTEEGKVFMLESKVA